MVHSYNYKNLAKIYYKNETWNLIENRFIGKQERQYFSLSL